MQGEQQFKDECLDKFMITCQTIQEEIGEEGFSYVDPSSGVVMDQQENINRVVNDLTICSHFLDKNDFFVRQMGMCQVLEKKGNHALIYPTTMFVHENAPHNLQVI